MPVLQGSGCKHVRSTAFIHVQSRHRFRFELAMGPVYLLYPVGLGVVVLLFFTPRFGGGAFPGVSGFWFLRSVSVRRFGVGCLMGPGTDRQPPPPHLNRQGNLACCVRALACVVSVKDRFPAGGIIFCGYDFELRRHEEKHCGPRHHRGRSSRAVKFELGHQGENPRSPRQRWEWSRHGQEPRAARGGD